MCVCVCVCVCVCECVSVKSGETKILAETGVCWQNRKSPPWVHSSCVCVCKGGGEGGKQTDIKRQDETDTHTR